MTDWLDHLPTDWWNRLAAEWGRLDLPDFADSLAVLLAAIAATVIVDGILFRYLFRRTAGRTSLAVGLLRRARRPVRLVMVLATVGFTAPRVALPNDVDRAIQHGALVGVIVLAGWTLLILSGYFTERSLRKHRMDIEDNLSARKFITQLRVLRRAGIS